MTPKEHAEKLLKKFMTAIAEETMDSEKIIRYSSKQCALVCVEEILNDYDTKILSGRPSHLESCKGFWIDVKEELKKL